MTETQTDLRDTVILIVDDVLGNLQILQQTLESENAAVQVATNGEKAIEIASHSHPDLILLDVNMPGIDGFETCRRLKKSENTRDIPVVFLTALTDTDSATEGFRAGGVDYICKPFQKVTLLARVQSHLKRARLRQTLQKKNRELAAENAHLEEQVAASTRELQLKVQELEKRNQVAQQLVEANKLRDALSALASTDLFSALDAKAIRTLSEEVEWVFVAGGECLFQQGEPGDALYVVLNGRLRAVITQPDGTDRIIGDIGRGECVGEMSVLTEESRSARVDAIRDSNLIKLSKTAFNRFKAQYPPILEQINQLLIQRIRAGYQSASSELSKGNAIALIPVDESVPITEFASRLTKGFEKTASTLHLNADRLDSYMEKGMAQMPETSTENRNIVAWLSAQETGERLIIYEADPSPSAWTARCIRQADRILIVGRVGANPKPGASETTLLNTSQMTVRTELVLLHPDDTQRPVNTKQWLTPRSVSTHHHIRLTEHADFERLVRMLKGQAMGLVLSGGAARGFAHIGAIRALKEHGIPIDAIGGTSMGSMVAVQYALGMNYEEMLAANFKGWHEAKPLSAYTFPIAALMTDKRLNDMLKEQFGEIQIEDLWLNCFCVSCSLIRAKAIIHHTGSLWKAVRASVSVPVVLPPLFEGGDIYVDGGVLNNLPTDVMPQFCDGYIIASDTSVGSEEMEMTVPELETLSGWQLLFSKLNPFSKAEPVLSLIDTAVRSVELGNVQITEQQRRDADFHLRSPIEDFGRFDWHLVEEIAQVGYQHALGEIEKWKKNSLLPDF